MNQETGLKRLKVELAMMEQRLIEYEEKLNSSRNNPDEYYFWFDRIKALKQEIKNKREYIWDIEFD